MIPECYGGTTYSFPIGSIHTHHYCSSSRPVKASKSRPWLLCRILGAPRHVYHPWDDEGDLGDSSLLKIFLYVETKFDKPKYKSPHTFKPFHKRGRSGNIGIRNFKGGL